MKKITSLAILAAFTSTALVPFAAFAESSSTVGVVHTDGTEINVQNTVSLPKIHEIHKTASSTEESNSSNGSAKHTSAEVHAHAVSGADSRINHRIASMTSIAARINAAKYLTAEQKTALTANLTATEGELATLKTKIDADTDSATFKADNDSVASAYRVYDLVIPQSIIGASADRELGVAASMDALGTKLAARIAASKASGADTSVSDAAYADFTAKVADAKTNANAAVAIVAALKADNGDKTILAANTAAIKDAKSKIKAVKVSLKAARADANIITKATTKHKVPKTMTASTTAAVHN